MSRKNTILGLGALAAFGFASVSFAGGTCPSSPVPPWTSQTQTQAQVAIVAGGMAGTACQMTSTLNAGAGSFAAATVRDTTPSNEPRYRVQFLLNVDALTGLGSFEAAYVFSVQSPSAHLGSPFVIRASVSGGAARNLNVFTANEGGSGNLSQTTIPLAAGENVIEMDWQVGAGNGRLDIWVNNSNSATPTQSLTNLNNSGWGGVDAANLGLAAANNLFRNNHAGKAVAFDEFDSRRQTFIGF